MSADWSIVPVIDWLMHKGRLLHGLHFADLAEIAGAIIR